MTFPKLLAVLSACAFACLSQAAPFYDVTDPYMAEYEGFWSTANGTKGRVTAQIRPVANNQFDGFVLLSRANGTVAGFQLGKATPENHEIRFTGTRAAEAGGELLAASEAKCQLRDGKLTGTFKGELGDGTFEATKSSRKSPTLGARPPQHAIVIDRDGWENFNWRELKDGVIQVAGGNLRAKEKISSFTLHLEFRTPYMPAEMGQDRGNSGVYLQGKYEVQVLDSFGLYPLRDNDCGGIYQVRAPIANASLPPMEWQTYDITYLEAGNGRPPMITVAHNGIAVIDRAEIPAKLVEKGTGGGEPGGGFLMLQDHGNPVQFRNIWVRPIYSSLRRQ